MQSFRTVLCPIDFSECSKEAFDVACSLAHDFGAQLIVLHVQLPTVVMYGEGTVPSDPTAYAVKLWEQLKQMQPRDQSIDVERRLEIGDPPTEIVRLADLWKCDLIVMGTHGRTGLRRVLMGSVAEAVLRKATCPVVTVRGQHSRNEHESA